MIELEGMLSPADLATAEQVFSKLTYKRCDIDLTIEQRLREREIFRAAMTEIGACHGTASCRQKIGDELVTLYPDDVDVPTLLDAFATTVEGLSSEQLEKLIVWAGPNMELPHHESSTGEIEDQMDLFRRFLSQHSLDREHPPALITIAKSSGDEFLPPHQAEAVLEALLNILEQVFGPIEKHEIEYEPSEQAIS